MKYLFAILWLITINAHSEQVTLSFEKITIPQLIELVYSDVLKKNYIIHDEVLKKMEGVTIRIKSNYSKEELENTMKHTLASYNIQIDKQKDHVFFKLNAGVKEGIPFFYKPKYRSTKYLVSLLGDALEKGSLTNKKEMENPKGKTMNSDGLNKLVDKDGDGLLFIGTPDKIELLKNLLAQTDIPEKQLHIQAFVYEVQNNENDSTALQVVLKTVKNTGINMSVGASRGAGQTFEITSKGLDILLNIFNSDNRFKVITSPSLFVKSGQKSNFTVGTETPILSGIKYPDNGSTGSPVQGVEYRSSGTIFEVKPTIHEENIDIELTQEISNFVPTTTGVSNSPTLIKRKLNTNLSLRSHQMIIMAGLKENKDTNDSTYLPFTKWEIGNEKVRARTEIIIMLYCQIVDSIQQPIDFNQFIADLPDSLK